jgi:hypothetical protein
MTNNNEIDYIGRQMDRDIYDKQGKLENQLRNFIAKHPETTITYTLQDDGDQWFEVLFTIVFGISFCVNGKQTLSNFKTVTKFIQKFSPHCVYHQKEICKDFTHSIVIRADIVFHTCDPD